MGTPDDVEEGEPLLSPINEEPNQKKFRSVIEFISCIILLNSISWIIFVTFEIFENFTIDEVKGVVPPILILYSLIAHILNNTFLFTGMKTDKYFSRYLQPMASV